FSLFRAPAPTAPYTLSLHDALPISGAEAAHRTAGGGHAGLSLRALRLRRTLAPLAVPELQELGHGQADPRRCRRIAMAALPATRSEEHTSELQSRENLVCRLLLEKK